MKGMPLIKSVMTAFPFSVSVDETLAKAQQMMEDHDIRHLPVKKDGKLVSVLTDHDIDLALRGTSSPAAPGGDMEVGDVCVFNAYIVDMRERLDTVLLHMGHHHIGCALVVKEDRLAGIFTMTDACRCFGEWLRSQHPVNGGGDAA